MKNNNWTKVKNLQVGSKIAVRDNDGNLDWDEIVSIKSIGRERVYDIEVENAHNFVAGHIIDTTGAALSQEAEEKMLSEMRNFMPDIFNDKRFFFGGILAHNTYVFGNVGIGVGIATSTPPEHTLQVAGDVAAEAFVNISTREAKKNIRYLADSDYRLALEKIASTSVAVYDYRTDKTDRTDTKCSEDNPPQPSFEKGGSASLLQREAGRDLSDLSCGRRLGLIAEEAPREVLSADGKGVDLYRMTSLVFAGVKALDEEVQDVKLEMADLEAAVENLEEFNRTNRTSTTYATNGANSIQQALETISGEKIELSENSAKALADSLLGSVFNAFRSLGLAFENGWMKVQSLFAENLETRKLAINIASDDQTNPNITPRDPTIGTGQINLGEKDAYILNNQVSTTSKIFITPEQPVAIGSCEVKGDKTYMTNMTNGTQEEILPGFRVCLAEPAKEIVKFNWWIIETNNSKQETVNSKQPGADNSAMSDVKDAQTSDIGGVTQSGSLSSSPEATSAASESPTPLNITSPGPSSTEEGGDAEVAPAPLETLAASPLPVETPAASAVPSPSPEATPAASEILAPSETPLPSETQAAN